MGTSVRTSSPSHVVDTLPTRIDVTRLPLVRTDTQVPTQIGRAAAPQLSPSELPAQFRVITQHQIDPPPFGRRGRIVQPEYNLTEIGKATDTDGLLRRAFDAHLTCVMKNGWQLAGRNDRTKSYIQRRLDEISFMSQAPFEQIVRQAAQDLIEYHNFFVYLVRQPDRSSGQPIVWHGKNKDPIAALHAVDPTTMYPLLGDTTEIRSWHQFIDGRNFSGRRMVLPEETEGAKRYSPEDVIHGFMRRRAGFIFGTPSAIPVLDDIRALRRLEEIAELIAHRHAFPFVHIKVGTERIPAKLLGTGEHEVDVVQRQYERVPLEGSMVTSERVTIVPIPLTPMDLSNLLEHYHRRAVTGLGLSDIDVGRGGTANRGTAVVLSRSLMDRCREYQRAIAMFFGFGLFDVLLLEGGFALTPENRVFLGFPEIDLDHRMAVNNHAMALYQGKLITETEARIEMGRDPITDAQRDDMFFERVDKPLAIIKAIDEPYTPEAKAAAKGLGGKAATATRNQPQNQGGRKAAKTPPANTRVRGADMQPLIHALRTEVLAYLDRQFAAGAPLSDVALREVFAKHREQIEGKLVASATEKIQTGFDRYRTDSRTPTSFFVGDPLKHRFRRRCVAPSLDRLFGADGESEILIADLRQRTADHVLRVASFFNAWDLRWDLLLGRLDAVAQRFGYLQAAWIDDSHEVHWHAAQPCPSCQDLNGKTVTPRHVTYYGLSDRDCAFEFRLLETARLPSRVPLRVRAMLTEGQQAILQLSVPGREDYLDLSHPGRFLKIVLDSQESAVLPEESTGGWKYDGSGAIHLPRFESGVAELWSDDRVVGRVRFEALPNGSTHGYDISSSAQ